MVKNSNSSPEYRQYTGKQEAYEVTDTRLRVVLGALSNEHGGARAMDYKFVEAEELDRMARAQAAQALGDLPVKAAGTTALDASLDPESQIDIKADDHYDEAYYETIQAEDAEPGQPAEVTDLGTQEDYRLAA